MGNHRHTIVGDRSLLKTRLRSDSTALVVSANAHMYGSYVWRPATFSYTIGESWETQSRAYPQST